MVRNERDETLFVSTPDDITFATRHMSDNGSNNVTISNVAPAGVGTATISKWLVVSIGGVTYYIPLWT